MGWDCFCLGGHKQSWVWKFIVALQKVIRISLVVNEEMSVHIDIAGQKQYLHFALVGFPDFASSLLSVGMALQLGCENYHLVQSVYATTLCQPL